MTATLSEPRGTEFLDEFSLLLDSEDEPMGFEAGDANLYRYVGNEPTNYTDPGGTATASVGGSIEGYPVIGKVGLNLDLNVRTWWVIPTDFSLTLSEEEGRGIGLGGGVGAHITGTSAQDLSQLTGKSTQVCIATPIAGANTTEGNGYRGVSVGVGGVGGGVAKTESQTREAFHLFFPWSPRAKWWLGIPNPFSRSGGGGGDSDKK